VSDPHFPRPAELPRLKAYVVALLRIGALPEVNGKGSVAVMILRNRGSER
jgi:hypothetical protein